MNVGRLRNKVSRILHDTLFVRLVTFPICHDTFTVLLTLENRIANESRGTPASLTFFANPYLSRRIMALGGRRIPAPIGDIFLAASKTLTSNCCNRIAMAVESPPIPAPIMIPRKMEFLQKPAVKAQRRGLPASAGVFCWVFSLTFNAACKSLIRSRSILGHRTPSV